jgi:S-adenosylmethionine uptake transporter
LTSDRPADDIARHEAGNVLLGLGLAMAGHAVFSVQDAVVKWLVAGHAVWQILFMRSVTITLISVALAARTGLALSLRTQQKPLIFTRAACMLFAWLSYYTAARSLTLPDLVTLYYASPLFVTVLAVFVLGERVYAARWVAVSVGFAGVLVAANPTGRADLLPAALVLLAAFLWGWAGILSRMIARTEKTETQMLFTNGLFVMVCGVTMPWLWRDPDLFELFLMVGIGCISGLGQYLVYESMRHAPASVVAPSSYTSLAWAFLWGLVIWGDVPENTVFAGAGIIVLGSLIMLWAEWRRPKNA